MHKLSIVGPGIFAAVIAISFPLFAQTTAPAKGIIVQGGKEAIGPKQDDPRSMQVGDCADDAVGQGKPGAGANAPAARQGIIVQGGLQAIGPKQDDPRSVAAGSTSMRSIGPKQDDPRAKATSCKGKKAKA